MAMIRFPQIAYRSPRGFTVIELMVVVALVAILVTVAAPSFSTMIKHTRVKGVASSLHMSLLKARSEAVKRNEAVSVVRKGGPGGNWNMGWDVIAGGTALETQPEQTGVSIESDQADPDDPVTITYMRSGRVQDNLNPTFTVDAQPAFTESAKTGRCRTVTLGVSGVPSVNRVDCP